ncbi:pilus assembly protein CpaC [Ochrobactrum sp. BH3]|nr:pilus assembly protein CpaC [Ochrobactrum sp. BH3]
MTISRRILLLSAAFNLCFFFASAIAYSNDLIQLTQNGTTRNVNIGLDKSIVLELPSAASDILVANPSIADAIMKTSSRVYVFGKRVGQTNIFAFDKDGNTIASINLQIERDVSMLSTNIRKYLPGSNIAVEIVNDNVVLTGTVQTPQDSTRAEQLAELFVAGGEATTGQYTQQGSSSRRFFPEIDNPDSTRRTSKIINLLKISGDDQVTLKVTVAEINRSVMKQLGINLLSSASSGTVGFQVLSENLAGAIGKPISNSGAIIGTETLKAYFNAMENAGVMKTLAEPTLTAVSGEKATFKVGGEYNIIGGHSFEENEKTGKERLTYDVQKVEYGIGLEFVPVVLSPGRISLKVRTSVSEPTFDGSVSLQQATQLGTNILSMRKRLADSTVELPSGGSMMIAGLIRDDVRQTVSGLPGLSKIPVLGALFRSTGFVRSETELVVIITPYLVRPVQEKDLARPDDNFTPASDPERYLLGRINRTYGHIKGNAAAGKYHGFSGHIYR